MTTKRLLILGIVLLTIPISMTLIDKFPGFMNSTFVCEDWLDRDFWSSASADDVKTCLAAGAVLDARVERDFTRLYVGPLSPEEILRHEMARKLGLPPAEHQTPLHIAAQEGNVEAITALLEAGARRETRTTKYGFTPLHIATQGGNVEAVTTLLKAGATLKARTQNGFTPLHIAAQGGNVEAVTTLLKAGATLKARTYNGSTPLHIAAGLGTSETVTALLKAGAELEARTQNGSTPLHMAAEYRTAEMIPLLLEAGAELEAQAKYIGTPLHISAASDATEVITALLEAGAELEARTNNGSTPLHKAAGGDSVEAVIALLEAGAQLEVRTKPGPVHPRPLGYVLGLSSQSHKIERWFDARSKNNATPLHIAAYSSIPETVMALLNAGANLKAQAKGGETPLDLAKENPKLKGTTAYWRLNEAQFK